MTSARIEVHEDGETLARAVAGELISRLADAQSAGGVPNLGLTGGTIAGRIHEELGRQGAASEVDWSRVVVWWTDERYVAPDSPDRNATQARETWLDVVGVDPANIHEMASTADAESAEAGAAAYSTLLRETGSGEFEVVMLGVGPDGHVASLFPGYPQLDVDDKIAVAVPDSPKPPPDRISLTYGALNRSRSVWFLVSGEEKATAVARALGSDDAPPADLHDIPAAGVTGTDETIWFLDRASASAL